MVMYSSGLQPLVEGEEVRKENGREREIDIDGRERQQTVSFT
jgi:hypothetical protein